jgi:hypothetical protein
VNTLRIPVVDRLPGGQLATRVVATAVTLPLRLVPKAFGTARKATTLVRGLTGQDQPVAPPPPAGPVLPSPVVLPDAVEQALTEVTPGAELNHDELPLADYDHLTLGSLRARLPKLDAVELTQLLDYERAHANRLPVVVMMENRLRKLGATAAVPTG